MIVNLKSISQEPKEFDFILEENWWKSGENDDQIQSLDEPLRVKIGIYPIEDKYMLKGEFTGGLKVNCDRCLEPFHHSLHSEFQLFFILSRPEISEEETELNEEDIEIIFLETEELELDDVIREQIYLSLPMKFICKENCLGLCYYCGINLNQGKCQCPQTQGHPGFSKLKYLKIRGEQE
jgi:uncharacterized protein